MSLPASISVVKKNSNQIFLGTHDQGSLNSLVGDEFGSLFASQVNARFYSLSKAGLVFTASYPVGSPPTSSTAGTITGPFALWNPINSGKNLVLLDATFGPGVLVASPTVVQVVITVVPNQIPTATTPGPVPLCTLVGSPNKSIANTYVAGTITSIASLLCRSLAQMYVGSTTVDVTGRKNDLSGLIVISPNSGIYLRMFGTNTSSIVGSYTWAELPA